MSQSRRGVVVSAFVRTPFGRFGGRLRSVEAVDLAAVVIRALLERSGLRSDEVQEVHAGACSHAEAGALAPVIARQALLRAGLPPTVVSETIDRACCSSLAAIQAGYRSLILGEADAVIALGAENMSRVPALLPDLRWGLRLGHRKLHDALFEMGYPGYGLVSVDAGEVALEHGVGREEQDGWALRSQQRYQAAKASGWMQEEVVPVPLPKGESLEEDEFPKPETTLESLAALRTVYGSATVTPGNAPGLDAGSAGLVLVREEFAAARGLPVLGRLLDVVSVATEPRQLATVPALAVRRVLERNGIALADVDRIEINEAFAAMPLVSTKVLADGDEALWRDLLSRTNVNGGAIAIGHPVGASGARIVGTLLRELSRLGGGTGVASICGGLAQGDAALLDVGPPAG